MGILELENVTVSYDGIRAVDNVSLEVEKGTIKGLIGPNGSGKTSLFNAISGIVKKEARRILFDGRRIEALSTHEIFDLGLARTFQSPRLFFGMTVLENSLIPPRDQRGESPLVAPFHRRWEPQEKELALKSHNLLSSLELQHLCSNLCSEVSGGQMKLLQLCLGLNGDPKLLMLDEPTAGVAPRLAQSIFENIQKQRKKGTTFFIIEHRLEVLMKCADSIIVMDQGKIIAEGRPDEIMKDQKVIDCYLG